ncbi:MAG: glycerate kinase type-2 family protein [Gemmataceae bacterium]
MSPADARAIWNAGVAAVQPGLAIPRWLATFDAEDRDAIANAKRILVLGAGKAGMGMLASLLAALPGPRGRCYGALSVPGDAETILEGVALLPGRPWTENHPTLQGVAAAEQILQLASDAEPETIGFVLISGGGTALLPLPVPGVSLAELRHLNQLLHQACAPIAQMNAVRKHLSRILGGQLAAAFRGRHLYVGIISDVPGDHLDVIASGPCMPDPTTFADAQATLMELGIWRQVSHSIRNFLSDGTAGMHPETPKSIPANVTNTILARNAGALEAAAREATACGFQVLTPLPQLTGDTTTAARALAERIVQEAPAAGSVYISGGETTVELSGPVGKGGRNQEFALAFVLALPAEWRKRVAFCIAGTDGEDGPTDAAGVCWHPGLVEWPHWHTRANMALIGHDAYPFWSTLGGLLQTGPTGTNVMDLRVIIITG